MQIIQFPEVTKFITSLDDVLSEKVSRAIEFLEKYSYDLEMPKSKPLGKGLFELRITGSIQIRIFYCFHEGKAYLLHAVIKKSMALNFFDIVHARRNMKWLASK